MSPTCTAARPSRFAIAIALALALCLFYLFYPTLPAIDFYTPLADLRHLAETHFNATKHWCSVPEDDIDEDLWPLRALCADKQWIPGLVMTCDNCHGGLGNVRNTFLACVRYAIEAGAELVIPQLRLRHDDDLIVFATPDKTYMNYMFDQDHFVASMGQGCPQMRLHITQEDIPYSYDPDKTYSIQPEELEADAPQRGLRRPDLWKMRFFKWLEAQTGGQVSNISTSSPVIVGLRRTYLRYPVYYDGKAFVKKFGHLLRIRSDLHVLADKIQQAIGVKFGLDVNQSEPIPNGTYYGAHLRTESDAHVAWVGRWAFSTFEEQSGAYIAHAIEAGLKVMYVASGDKGATAQLGRNAEVHGIEVIEKSALLEGADLEELNTLTWDQQAVVDFLVLQRSSAFGGVAHSSFAWNTALLRHWQSKRDDYLDGPQCLQDEYSTIYGDKVRDEEIGLYSGCMWP